MATPSTAPLQVNYETPENELTVNGARLVHYTPTQVSEGDDRHGAEAGAWAPEHDLDATNVFREAQYAAAQRRRQEVLTAMSDPSVTGARVTREIRQLLQSQPTSLTHEDQPLRPVYGEGDERPNPTPIAWSPEGRDAPTFSNLEAQLATAIESATLEITARLKEGRFKQAPAHPTPTEKTQRPAPQGTLQVGEV